MHVMARQAVSPRRLSVHGDPPEPSKTAIALVAAVADRTGSVCPAELGVETHVARAPAPSTLKGHTPCPNPLHVRGRL